MKMYNIQILIVIIKHIKDQCLFVVSKANSYFRQLNVLYDAPKYFLKVLYILNELAFNNNLFLQVFQMIALHAQEPQIALLHFLQHVLHCQGKL